jgi:putative PIN family toxin of toxin-antitoxin system
MRLLLDTNVLFSALGFRGVAGKLLEEIVEGAHILVTSDYILAELQEKIRLKFKPPQRETALDLLLYLLQRIPLEVKQPAAYLPNLAQARASVPDEEDAPILAVALLPDIDYFVTGDKAHFLGNEQARALLGQRLVSPRQLLDLLLKVN